MEHLTHRYIAVAYDLFSDNEAGIHELLEKAPAEHPYQFITNLGMAQDAFEKRVCELNAGDKFDFTLTVEEGYGPYEEDRVIDFPKEMFCVNGHFMKEEIYPGNVIPLVNNDGNHFLGLVLKVEEKTVTVDLNPLYAGRELHYRGQVIDVRDATNAEIEGALNMMSGGGCGCGCDDCGDDCGHGGCHHGDGGCHHGDGHCGHGDGHCGHHHDHDGHCGCGHHH